MQMIPVSFSKMKSALNTTKQFSSHSGLKLNVDKTEGLLIENLVNNIPEYNKIKWPKEQIRYLGIYISGDQTCIIN